TYLILGKSSGWAMDTDLSQSDASFWGEEDNDQSGRSVSGAGNVNGDGFDDILIGAKYNNAGGSGAGQTYLISGFGYTEPLEVYSVDLYSDIGFSTPASVADIGETIYIELKGLDSNASNKDTAVVNVTSRPGSFGLMRVGCVETGLNTGVYRGIFKVPLGTLYLDDLKFYSIKDPSKFDMIFIDNPFRPTSISSLKTYYDDQYSIEVEKVELGEKLYIEIIGTDSNSISRNIALVNISTEYSIPIPFPLVLQETDINTGVYRTEFQVPENYKWLENIRLTSCRDPSFYTNIKIDIPFRPTSIDSLKVCSDSSYSKMINKIQQNETIFIEVVGQDANGLTQNKALVNITSDETFQIPVVLPIHETDVNTGIYRGSFKIPTSTKILENLTISSARDPTKSAKVMVCILIEIGPKEPIRISNEDEEYRVQYSNLGYADLPTWTYKINCDWLMFDMDTFFLSGTPDNEDVGFVSVMLNLSDDIGHFNVQEFTLKVNNTPPKISGTDIVEIGQDEYYEVDYDCDDDGQGEMTYYVTSSADWLEMDPDTGVLFGKPENDDVGVVTVTVSVTDGNDGWDSRQFDITVNNVNDAPRIISDDITSVNQGDPFVRHYQAEEIDVDDEIRWNLETDADFLDIDEDTGILTGTPTHLDVGTFYVNVSVWDLSDAFDYHNFTLTVKNINDPPVWTDFPSNTQVVHAKTFLYDVEAIDYDGDMLKFYISSTPASDIAIDEYTGEINWTADIHLFRNEPYKLDVKVSVFDSYVYVNKTFTITVLATEPPLVELTGPNFGVRTASTGTILTWEGTDPEDEPITYDIYVHQTEAFVVGLREEAIYEVDYSGDNITVTGLEPGKTYYWTVIPNDGCSYGECDSGVLSFRVNYKPTFKEIEDQKTSTGADFKYKISCTDQDAEDITNLRYSLKEAPEGMTISEETGMIRWKPNDNQAMLHSVVVEVSDGIETNTATFRVEVSGGESSSSSLLIIIAIVVIAVILVGIGVFLIFRQKKKMDEKALKKGEEERAALEKEREQEYLSYEQLYGVPAPEKEEEGMTTQELKEYLHGQIEELEE
ncbi:MAG: FG-GAP repeat protein, partial [Candidatus Thermoplasmatota archaeon]|nr:FG-GAP repeat protein [Candidatus Thermoplasmatota archaeon]